MTTLAVIRLAGSDRVQLLGALAGGRRPRHMAGSDPDEPVEVAPDDRPVAAGDLLAVLEREELESLTLEAPAELVRVEGFTEGAVAGAQGYVSHYLVSMLPFGHHVVYFDSVVGLTLLPLEPADGAEVEGIVAAYLTSREQARAAVPSRPAKERRRIHLT